MAVPAAHRNSDGGTRPRFLWNRPNGDQVSDSREMEGLVAVEVAVEYRDLDRYNDQHHIELGHFRKGCWGSGRCRGSLVGTWCSGKILGRRSSLRHSSHTACSSRSRHRAGLLGKIHSTWSQMQHTCPHHSTRRASTDRHRYPPCLQGKLCSAYGRHQRACPLHSSCEVSHNRCILPPAMSTTAASRALTA